MVAAELEAWLAADCVELAEEAALVATLEVAWLAVAAVSELVLVVCSVAVCVFCTCTAVVLAASFTSSALTLTLLPKAKNIPKVALATTKVDFHFFMRLSSRFFS